MLDDFTEAERMAMSDSEYDLAQENAILRERLLERNNVHRRLVKMRSALERIAYYPLVELNDQRVHNEEPLRDIARQALEGESE